MEYRTGFFYDNIKQESDPGYRLQDIWELCPDAKDEFDIQKSKKKKDIQAEINSYKEMCDIENILARFQRGDISAIGDPKVLQYGDVSDIPESMQELADNVSEAYKLWNDLSDEVKSSFDNDIHKFYEYVGSEVFMNAFIKKNEEEVIKASDEANV